jgi:hypothetical protein
MSSSDRKSANEVQILQFNQMKGLRSGKREEVRRMNGELTLSTQQAVKLPGEYLVAVVEDGKIVEWQPASMFDMRCTAVKEQENETKVQKWSLEHKKSMVSQFGTSKSKRKLNQMMNNIIE